MVREIRKSLKVRKKKGNFKIVFVQIPQKIEQTGVYLLINETKCL